MVVTHTPQFEKITATRDFYRPCNGVIIGWHFKCDATFLNLLKRVDESHLMGKLNCLSTLNYLYLLNKLTTVEPCLSEFQINGLYHYNQPHYIILTDDNDIRYAEEGININSILFFYYYLSVEHEIYQFYFRCSIDMLNN